MDSAIVYYIYAAKNAWGLGEILPSALWNVLYIYPAPTHSLYDILNTSVY